MNIKQIIVPLLALMLVSGLGMQPVQAQKEKSGREELSEPLRNQRTEMFMEANKQRLLGNPKQAEKLYKDVLALDPDHAPSMYELARLYENNGRTEDAILLMNKAISLDKQNVWYRLLLADLYKKTRQFDKVIEIFEQLTQLYPDKIDYYYDLALANIITGNFKAAIDTYDKIEEKLGVTEEISLQKQKLYLNMDKPNKAIEEIEKLVAAHPYNSRYLQILAESYMSNNEDKKALDVYRKIAEIDPENPYIHISLSDYYRKQGEPEKAYEQLKLGFANPNLDLESKVQVLLSFYTVKEFYGDKIDDAYQLAKILAETHPHNTRALSILGDLQYRKQEYEPALKTFNKVLASDSSQYGIWEQKLFILDALGRNKELAQTSAVADELFPMQPLPYLFNGIANYRLKDLEAARKALENGMNLVVDNDALQAQFYTSLGDIYNELGNHQKSDTYYDKALKLNPDDPYVLNNYSYYLSLRNTELEKARTMAARANELEPGNASFQDTYGWVLYQLGEYQEAEKWIKKALDNGEEDSAVLLEHYGDVLYKLGHKEKAVHYWKKAKEQGGETSGLLDQKINSKSLIE